MAEFNHTSAALRVCVDQTEGGRVSGRVYSQMFTAPLSFSDTGNLVLQVDAVMDAQNFPQAFQRSRTFAPRPQTAASLAAATPELGIPADAVAAAAGARATFLVMVVSRRSSSWQGLIDWLDGTPKEEFSSALELIRAIDARFAP
ncbi:MAG: hypothetical protein GX585_03015 [Clostridiales bacterium]|nr:hypothetical protein [Clostridiales bacterium]